MARSRLIAAAAVLIAAAACGDATTATTPTSEAAPASSTATSAAPAAIAPSTEEFRFESGRFGVVGTLHLPGGNGPHPALILVHSSGDHTRDSTPSAGLVRLEFLDAGYAVASWDKPGTGESTGELDPEYRTTELATIVADAVALLREHPAIDGERIGVWGLSQAGWVMPKALTLTDDITFMIVVSGGGEDSVETQVYQWMQRARCAGATAEELALMDEHGARALKATEYAEFRDAMEELVTIEDLDAYVGVDIEITSEEDWRPWPRETDLFFDPMTVIERTTIPILAVFGADDIQVDPVQGAEAYVAALERAENTVSHVEVIPDVGHILTASRAEGCAVGGGGYAPRYVELLEEFIEQLEAP